MLPSKLNVLLHEAIAAGDTAVIEALEGDAGIKAVIRPIVDRVGLVWDECFEGCSLHHAKQLSSADRGQIENLASINLTYGEVSFHSLALAMCGHVDLKVFSQIIFTLCRTSGPALTFVVLIFRTKKYFMTLVLAAGVVSRYQNCCS
jgi:hypothetical protein